MWLSPLAGSACPTGAKADSLMVCNGSAGLCGTLLTDAGAYGDGGGKISGPSSMSSEDVWLFSAKPPLETRCHVPITKISIAVFVPVPKKVLKIEQTMDDIM